MPIASAIVLAVETGGYALLEASPPPTIPTTTALFSSGGCGLSDVGLPFEVHLRVFERDTRRGARSSDLLEGRDLMRRTRSSDPIEVMRLRDLVAQRLEEAESEFAGIDAAACRGRHAPIEPLDAPLPFSSSHFDEMLAAERFPDAWAYAERGLAAGGDPRKISGAIDRVVVAALGQWTGIEARCRKTCEELGPAAALVELESAILRSYRDLPLHVNFRSAWDRIRGLDP